MLGVVGQTWGRGCHDHAPRTLPPRTGPLLLGPLRWIMVGMDLTTKKRTSNLLFFIGLPVLIIGIVLIGFGTILGAILFILGGLATIASIVVGFLPVRW